MSRNIFEAIRQIEAVLPPGVNTRELHEIADSASYAAPEVMRWWWNKLAEWVNMVVPFPPIEQWHFEVASILTYKSIDEIKEMVSSYKQA